VGHAEAEQLRALNVKRGILLTMAEEGMIDEVRCLAEECYSTKGRTYFEYKLHPPGPWAPSDGHNPKLKRDGGQRLRDNTRLEHTRCNNLDFKRLEITDLTKRAEAVARWHAKYGSSPD
jgi:hypothetical protein